MSNDMRKCDCCGELKRNVERQPSRRQLLFGGFNVTYENRCPACERDTARWALCLIQSEEREAIRKQALEAIQ
jgi:hypothetical protein